ncbi:MAG: HD domain-containing protein [Oscillospiraceae bacterium]|nr:HD domain-containing protein [Oscillospiraceae bacterium]MDE6658110.1 HD domain-containing protein [Oscillospiraceae bacterium]
MQDRFSKQIAFLLELDKMKNIYRQTLVLHEDRPENDAEHSFHLAMMACILAEHAKQEINILHVVKMVLIHDVVEIDAGDTYCYDTIGYQDKAEREQKARDRIFALLPDDQKTEYCALWDEFEERITPESKFANALDRIQPMLLNFKKGGISWKKHNIYAEQVEKRNLPITQDGSDSIYELAQEIIRLAKQEGMLL